MGLIVYPDPNSVIGTPIKFRRSGVTDNASGTLIGTFYYTGKVKQEIYMDKFLTTQTFIILEPTIANSIERIDLIGYEFQP